MSSISDKIFFFDRDGIVNRRPMGGYVQSVDEFVFNPDFFELFYKINKAGFITALITNQQGVGKKLMTDEQLLNIHEFMQKVLMGKTGCRFNEIKYCSSLKTENDLRRKPNPGMLLEVIGKYHPDLNNCFFIGDSESDVLAGKAAGVKTILINNIKIADPDYYFNTLKELNNRFLSKIA